MMGKTIALVAVVGTAVIALADAPEWKFEPFAGWLAAVTAVAILGQFQPDIGQALAVFLLIALTLDRGAEASRKVGLFVN